MKAERIISCFLGLFFVTALLLGTIELLTRLSGEESLPSSATDSPKDYPTVILDAGHGGEDGGAVGINGVLEKDLNLSLSFTLKEMLESAGVRVIMTRTDDRLLYTEEQNIPGHRKQNDLRNRLAISEGVEDGILVSIHMNRFPEEYCRGLQVYYSENDSDSRSLAGLICENNKKYLQPDNKRAIKAADSSIYLLHRSNNPAVMVECGFLSNRAECENLSKEDYRRRLSFLIFCGIMEYIEVQA